MQRPTLAGRSVHSEEEEPPPHRDLARGLVSVSAKSSVASSPGAGESGSPKVGDLGRLRAGGGEELERLAARRDLELA